MSDNSVLLPLTTLDKKITGAQIIKPNGDKKLLSGSQKKGAFIIASELKASPDTIPV
ncbi:hypothetical protein [Xenorhabdus ehlersii]|uniref:hypothetical protein n=1 Tax=Xenorhabdus ehlersii TaxID=290111 RepID=UPI0014759AF3|nr:hypothetical protein [Xenorhabdus ehlersii]